MHKMHNSFSMPQWEECQASGKWENERKSNQTADHLPKCISLMFSIFATTSSPSTPHKTTVYIHLYYILDNPLHFFTTSNFAPINDVPPPHFSLSAPSNSSSSVSAEHVVVERLNLHLLYHRGPNAAIPLLLRRQSRQRECEYDSWPHPEISPTFHFSGLSPFSFPSLIRP